MNRAPRTQQQGFTLLELLAAISLAAIVLTGLATAVASQSRSAIFTLGSADMSQDVRSALDLFKRDVRMAGFNLGAVPTAVLAPIVVNPLAAGEVYHVTLRGNYQNVSSTGSGVLSTITLDATAVPLCQSLTFTVGKRVSIESKILGVAEVTTIAGWSPGPPCTLTLATNLAQVYDPGSPVHQIDDVVYILNAQGVLRRNGSAMADGITAASALQVNYILTDGTAVADPAAVLDTLRAASIRMQAIGTNNAGLIPSADATTQVRIRNIAIATAPTL